MAGDSRGAGFGGEASIGASRTGCCRGAQAAELHARLDDVLAEAGATVELSEVLLTSGEAQTMPPFIPFIIGEGGQDWPAVAAATALTGVITDPRHIEALLSRPPAQEAVVPSGELEPRRIALLGPEARSTRTTERPAAAELPTGRVRPEVEGEETPGGRSSGADQVAARSDRSDRRTLGTPDPRAWGDGGGAAGPGG